MIENDTISANRSLAVGQRIRLRGRVWEIEDVSDAGGGQLLALRNVAAPLDVLRVVADVERIDALDAPELDGAIAPYRDWKILHDAFTLSQRPPPGELVGFEDAKITPEDYQLIPTIRALQRPMQRILIADDVGSVRDYCARQRESCHGPPHSLSFRADRDLRGWRCAPHLARRS